MEELVDNYIYQVTKRLSPKVKEDVTEELYVTILDMLEGDISDQKKVEAVLKTLGNPKLLALKYQDAPNFLISKLNYETYLLYLKFSLAVCGILGFLIGSLGFLFYNETTVYLKILNSFCVGIIFMLIGFILAYSAVTFLFSIIDRYEHEKTTWDLSKLAKKPSHDKLHIPKEKTLIRASISVILGVLGCVLVSMQKLGIKDSQGILQPFFNPDLKVVFIPLFLICLLIGLITTYVKIKEGQWNLKTTIFSTVYLVFMTLCILAFILQPDIITKNYIYTLAERLNLSIEILNHVVKSFTIGSSVVLAGIIFLLIGKRWSLIIKYK